MTATRGFNLSLPLVQEQRMGGVEEVEAFFNKSFFLINLKIFMLKARFVSRPGRYMNINAYQSSIKFQQLFTTSDPL